MADTIAAPEAEETEDGKRFPLKLVLVALVVVGALAAAYVFVLAPGGEEGAGDEPPAPTYSEEAGEPIVVDSGTTASVGGERRYAMLTYSVRPSVDADVDAVQLEFPRMRSEVARLLLSYDANRLLTPEGIDELEAGLTGVADEIWPHGEVVEVYLENIVVQ